MVSYKKQQVYFRNYLQSIRFMKESLLIQIFLLITHVSSSVRTVLILFLHKDQQLLKDKQ